ncbi:MAG: pyridoxal-phosphate dependent enzyme [Flavobacteriales bacterium]|nr:pyridoxal-phosphate dependent enzyme [Flavobacteriales bacterium]MDW8432218.1 pyridoxal-phosphate dependent enzyme [Flavobacteriales bacterium]
MNGFILSDGSRNFSQADRVWYREGSLPLELRKNFEGPSALLVSSLKAGIWDPVIPLDNPHQRIHLGEGRTPLLKISWGGRSLWVKAEYQNPTGSFKDRGAAVMISRAREEGASEVLEDSSGNAGCSVAAYAAYGGLNCQIFVPNTASPSKIRMMERLGARVIQVPGGRQAATDAAFRASQNGWFASHVWCPWFLEGTKIFAYELWQECGGSLPEEIIFPVGNGTLILGAWMGFSELKEFGLLTRMPALSAAFSEACAPLLAPNGPFGSTRADGIAVQRPARREQILDCVNKTGGRLYSVTELDLWKAWEKACKMGFYIEYTCAVALAALAQSPVYGDILVPLTGTGLKNPETH